MRQNDGSEILGPNDPRNLVIGIIHVSPNDDRQSVITAITTQDRLGRDQIVLDLPSQNKSFNSSVDFEGLHQMASEIEASLVLVAPQKSKIANLQPIPSARRRSGGVGSRGRRRSRRRGRRPRRRRQRPRGRRRRRP